MRRSTDAVVVEFREGQGSLDFVHSLLDQVSTKTVVVVEDGIVVEEGVHTWTRRFEILQQ